MTLTDVAQATGISIGTLSQLERGIVSPTVRTVFTLGTVLGVSPARLIDPVGHLGPDPDAPFIVRAGSRRSLVDEGGVRKNVISPEGVTHLKAFHLTVEPDGTSGAAPYSHTGEELGFVVSGTLELQIGVRTFLLNEGDCFAFDSRTPHRFRNPGAGEAEVVWINSDG